MVMVQILILFKWVEKHLKSVKVGKFCDCVCVLVWGPLCKWLFLYAFSRVVARLFIYHQSHFHQAF